MKNYILLAITVTVFAIGGCNAQLKRITGPSAKNAKHLTLNPSAIIMITNHDHKPLLGPKAKNKKPGEDDCEMVTVKSRKRRKLQGPKAKNTRPEDKYYWEDQPI